MYIREVFKRKDLVKHNEEGLNIFGFVVGFDKKIEVHLFLPQSFL